MVCHIIPCLCLHHNSLLGFSFYNLATFTVFNSQIKRYSSQWPYWKSHNWLYARLQQTDVVKCHNESYSCTRWLANSFFVKFCVITNLLLILIINHVSVCTTTAFWCYETCYVFFAHMSKNECFHNDSVHHESSVSSCLVFVQYYECC